MTYDMMEKWFRLGDNVSIRTPGGGVRYYEITGKDPIFYVHDHDLVAAGGTQSYAEITNLDPPINQLYQFNRIILVVGNVKVFIKQPAATNRFGTNKSPEGGYLSMEYDEMKVELFALENFPPNVQIVNGTLSSITPRLRWHGYRYTIKELPTKLGKPGKFTPITLED